MNLLPTKSTSRRKKILTLGRLSLSLVLLLILYSSIDLGSLLVTIKQISLASVLLLLALYAFGQFVSVLKWRIFITQTGIERGLAHCTRSYFFGMLINTFGLGTVGGDVARSLALFPEKGRRAAALASVVADRVHGLATLLSIGAIAIVIVHPPSLGHYTVFLENGAIAFLVVFWCAGPYLLTKLFPPTSTYGAAAIIAAQAFPRKPAPFLLSTIISVFFHSIQIYMHFLIAQQLGAPLELSYLFATVPLVNAVSAMPLTVNGLGLREAMYVLLFVPMGASQEMAIAFGAIWILIVSTVSAIGGILLLPKWKELRDKLEPFPESSEDDIEARRRPAAA